MSKGPMKTAVYALVVGSRFECLFRDYVFTSWQAYCQSHGYELVVFRKPLAEPGKSLAWQKLFVLRQPELSHFEKIIWVDSDIIIKANSPPIEVPAGRIGYTVDPPRSQSVADWYAQFNLPPANEVVQTGVICLEPQHDEILRRALQYPDTIMYEMPALSKCLSESGLGYRLDPRFNALIATMMLDYVPRWILTTKLIKELLWKLHYPPLRRAVREICEKNWFMHAAGAKLDLIKVNRQLGKLTATAR